MLYDAALFEPHTSITEHSLPPKKERVVPRTRTVQCDDMPRERERPNTDVGNPVQNYTATHRVSKTEKSRLDTKTPTVNISLDEGTCTILAIKAQNIREKMKRGEYVGRHCVRYILNKKYRHEPM